MGGFKASRWMTKCSSTPPRLIHQLDKNRLFPVNEKNKESILNITFSIDEQVGQLAREAAKKMGKSLDQVVLDYVQQLARSAQPRD